MTGQFTRDPEHAGTATIVERSALNRRREKLQASKTAARTAIDAVADLDARLDDNSSQTRENEAALQAALDQVAALKKAIKSAGKQKLQLISARKDARRAAAQARQRAAAAEAKYDRAVLAEIVRREKDHDLSLHSPATSAGTAASDARPDATSTIAGKGESPTLDTARTTAARATADRAQVSTRDLISAKTADPAAGFPGDRTPSHLDTGANTADSTADPSTPDRRNEPGTDQPITRADTTN